MTVGGSGAGVGEVEHFLVPEPAGGLVVEFRGRGLEDDQVHSPNEKFEVTCFQKGLRSHVRLLGKMGG